MFKPIPLRTLMFSGFRKNKATGCWLWKKSKNKQGYGYCKVNRKTRYAHRVMFELERGLIPKGFCVMHTCDTPSCVNPKHLKTGTLADNVEDMDKKRRRNPPRGERHWKSILKTSDVKAIRKSKELLSVLAPRYGVSQATISMVRNLKIWKGVKP